MKTLLILLLCCTLAACASSDVEQYAAEQPALSLPDYLNGDLQAWGMFQDRSGKVVKRFHVQMTGQWQGNTGTLDERFTYSDGSTERRVWTLTRQSDGSWQGTADDVEGVATGKVAGNAFHWAYRLRLPVDGRTWVVDLDDRMYLIDEKVMLNRAIMSKWGVTLGSITLNFYKR
ncbi:Protein of unknown function [Halopseudomonas sabulinigri]|uniref:DUF3833 domain-containing protein n=1 Tax=Halopseudomonas sabulinigri TaxID=472181 RepID=A0A1H1SLV8_9GAMM|nr:DUF3833 domain-containing protein [Halopseudomonas sabulinigri]SDS48911.1 Protein of unknown function [Halopseudomonas sabulinigri]